MYKCCLLLQKEGATPLIAKNALEEISLSDEMVLSKLIMYLLFVSYERKLFCHVMSGTYYIR